MSALPEDCGSASLGANGNVAAGAAGDESQATAPSLPDSTPKLLSEPQLSDVLAGLSDKGELTSVQSVRLTLLLYIVSRHYRLSSPVFIIDRSLIISPDAECCVTSSVVLRRCCELRPGAGSEERFSCAPRRADGQR